MTLQFESSAFQPVTAPTAAPPCRARLMVLSQLTDADHAQWAALSAASSGSNIFAMPWFMTSVLSHFDPAGTTRLGIVTNAPGQWIGVIPVEKADRLGRMPARLWQTALNPNQFLGTPLVRAGCEEAFWAALLCAFDQSPEGQWGVHCPALPSDDPVTQALIRLCDQQKRGLDVVHRVERAAHQSVQSFDAYWAMAVSAKRDKRITSLSRQIERDLGPLSLDVLTGGDGLDRWMAAYLDMEARGWKGVQGSALLSCRQTEDLFRDVLLNAAAAGVLECLTLKAGGRPIALSVQFIGLDHGFGFKTSYDEKLARYAPGILLLRAITQRLHARPGLFFDSCSKPDQSSINGMWKERRTLIDCVVALRSFSAESQFTAHRTARGLWSRAKTLFAGQ